MPKGGGVYAFFAASLWLGGTAPDGELRFSGSDYGAYEFVPGPLDADGDPPADCEAADRMWRVTLADVVAYNTTGEATPDLAEWPAHLGAPVVDGDGDPSTYSLAGGDRPAILGDETVWWVMNDRGAEPDWGRADPVGVEVRATAFTVSDTLAVGRLGYPRDAATHLHHATMYRFEIDYRGSDPLDSVYVALFADPDLGDFGDDYMGSAPDRRMAYVYNAGNDDLQYGPSPPAVGVAFASGPALDQPGGAMTFGFGGITGDADDATDAYNLMRSRWLDGRPLRNRGFGTDAGAVVTYQFSGLPPAPWSEFDWGDGLSSTPSNRVFSISHGPFGLRPGETVEVAVAIPWARSDFGHLVSLRELLLRASPVAISAAAFLEPLPDLATVSALPTVPPPPPPEPDLPADFRALVAPNPMRDGGALTLDLPEPAAVRVVLSDALGRRVATLLDGPQDAGTVTAPLGRLGLAPGTYLLRIEADPETQPRRLAFKRFTVAQ